MNLMDHKFDQQIGKLRRELLVVHANMEDVGRSLDRLDARVDLLEGVVDRMGQLLRLGGPGQRAPSLSESLRSQQDLHLPSANPSR